MAAAADLDRYRARLGGPLSTLLAPFGERWVSVNSVAQNQSASQLIPLAASLRDLLAWSERCAGGGRFSPRGSARWTEQLGEVYMGGHVHQVR